MRKLKRAPLLFLILLVGILLIAGCAALDDFGTKSSDDLVLEDFILKDDEEGNRRIEAVEMQLDGKGAYLRSIYTPGIWHREELLPTYLARDVEMDWRKPFPAKWKTQLLEGKIETTFYFAWEAREIWRPNFGFYNYPVWFAGDSGFLHLGKKVPPRGQALIYALEDHKDTPVEFARAHLGSLPTLKPRKGLRRYPLDNVGIQNCDGEIA